MKKIKIEKSELVTYMMTHDELESLYGKENEWEGSIPQNVIDILKDKLNVPKGFSFDHLESDFDHNEEFIEDKVYVGFTRNKVIDVLL